jgi:hypothetical protein
MDTFYLDPVAWDLVVGADGNFVMATDGYAIAQDVASAVRCFAGECWYDTTQGVPYREDILGKRPASVYLKNQIKRAALTVPGVTGVAFNNLALNSRGLSGQILVTTSTSTTPIEVNF